MPTLSLSAIRVKRTSRMSALMFNDLKPTWTAPNNRNFAPKAADRPTLNARGPRPARCFVVGLLIGEGIWVIGGYSIVNCIVIEAPDGLIVYDTGDFGEEGKHFREVIEEKISKAPIKAIIYSHSHYALAGCAMVDDPKMVMVIGHPS